VLSGISSCRMVGDVRGVKKVGNALLNFKEVFDMGPKMGKVTRFTAVGLATLALSTGAEAAFVSYSASGTDTGLLSAASAFIDVAGLTAFSIDDSLAFSLTSASGSTVSTAALGLQTIQGCISLGASCTGGDAAHTWFDLPIAPLTLGGTSFSAPAPTGAFGPATGHFDVGGGLPVASLRLKFNGDSISPPASIGMSGSLSVSAVPEPGAWAMMLAGIIGVAGIARRRIG